MPVDEYLASTFKWRSGYPTDNEDDACVALYKLELMNVPCGGQDYFFGPTVTDANEPTLGYLCEARVIKTLVSGETCVFPFVFDNVTYTSCSMVDIGQFEGKPWCATQVDANKNVVFGKWSLCQDERKIIYDGDGAGYACPIPFILDRVMYDFCTRTKPDLSPGFADYFWCPDPNFVTAENEYSAPNPIGKCTDFLIPIGEYVIVCPVTIVADS